MVLLDAGVKPVSNQVVPIRFSKLVFWSLYCPVS
jgi:hypothetical protein